MNNVMKRLKKGIAALTASLVLTTFNPVYAADFSIKIAGNGVLRSDSNYYGISYNYNYDAYIGTRKAVKNISYANNNFFITSDHELYYYDEKIMDNVAMVSELGRLNNDFYYLDTDGNLMHSGAPYRIKDFGLDLTLVIENIGDLKQLSYGYALTEKGELYNLGKPELMDTDVKSFQLYSAVYYTDHVSGGKLDRTEIIYIKNNNSLYSSYGINENEKSKHLLDNVTYYEVNGLQLRAKTSDNSWYEWGDNISYQVYKEMVDGYDVTLKYVAVPRKITDNILYQDDNYELRIDGSFYRKDLKSGQIKYTLLDTNVASVVNFDFFYIYQKFNDAVYSINVFSKKPVAGTSKLLCENAVKGLDNDHFIFKKDGTMLIFNNNGKVFETIIPTSKYFSSSNWAQAELQEADKLGLLDSVIDHVFDINITRMEFCTLIVDMCESYMGKEMPISGSNPFNDLDYDSLKDYKDNILKAYAAGIVNGTNASTFSPYSEIDRQQMAAMMYRAAKYLNSGLKAGKPVKFADADKISSFATEGVNAMSSLGIIKGSDGKFNPNDKATIEQSAVMVLRLLKMLKQTK